MSAQESFMQRHMRQRFVARSSMLPPKRRDIGQNYSQGYGGGMESIEIRRAEGTKRFAAAVHMRLRKTRDTEHPVQLNG
jgi:hypothetical protein